MKKKTILVVDDSEIVLAMATDALESADFRVLTALNAKGADKFIFSQDRPDLIILDVMLPMLDGDKKAKMLKENGLVKDIPILLLSSKAEDILRVLTKEAGVEGFIRKPFVKEQLLRKVQDTLGLKND